MSPGVGDPSHPGVLETHLSPGAGGSICRAKSARSPTQWEPMGVPSLQDALFTEERMRIVRAGDGTRPPSALLQEGVCTTPSLGAQVKLFPMLACLTTIPG